MNDTIKGDDGGPLVVKTNEKYVLVGVLSYVANTCDG